MVSNSKIVYHLSTLCSHIATSPLAPGPANSFSPIRACLNASYLCFSSPHSCPLLELSYQSFFLSLGPFHFLTFQSSLLSSSDSLFPLHLSLHPPPSLSSPILPPSLFSLCPLLQSTRFVTNTVLDISDLVFVKTAMSSAVTKQRLVANTNKCRGSCHIS